MSKVFKWICKDLDQNYKHFKSVELWPSFTHDKNQRILEDNTLSDITFETFQSRESKLVEMLLITQLIKLNVLSPWEH